MIYYAMMVASVLVSAVAQILLKKAAGKKYPNVVREYLNWYVILGYALFFGATILSTLAYRGIAYVSGPIIGSLGYCLTMLSGWLFFQEKITWNKLVGNVLIIGGIILFYLP